MVRMRGLRGTMPVMRKCHACRWGLALGQSQRQEGGQSHTQSHQPGRRVSASGMTEDLPERGYPAARPSRHTGAGRQQIALDERGRDASPDLRSESPARSQRAGSGGLLVLCSGRRTWENLVRRTEGAGWRSAHSLRTPPMADICKKKSDSVDFTVLL